MDFIFLSPHPPDNFTSPRLQMKWPLVCVLYLHKGYFLHWAECCRARERHLFCITINFILCICMKKVLCKKLPPGESACHIYFKFSCKILALASVVWAFLPICYPSVCKSIKLNSCLIILASRGLNKVILQNCFFLCQ